MKLIHISDLHIGKKIHGFAMLEDQKYILDRFLEIVQTERPDAILIAGDVYDTPTPSAEAVSLFDDFIVRLASYHIPTFIISGNHDSAERLSFGSRLIDISGIHFSPTYSGQVEPTILTDEHGDVAIYMLPFVRPATVRALFPEATVGSFTDAMAVSIENMHIDTSVRNVLIAHAFVTGASTSGSEESYVGTAENVDACVFADFDYVALGHIHRPQNIGEHIRYSGSILKYSFSEVNHDKSVTIVNMGAKGDISIDTLPLVPLHDMHHIKGSYNDLTFKDFYAGTSYPTDYMYITLTDEDDIIGVRNLLGYFYTNIMKIDYDNTRTRNTMTIEVSDDIDRKSPLELFCDFYELQNGQSMTQEQEKYMKQLIDRLVNKEDEA